MNARLIYSEKVSSKRTEFLFVALTLLFFLLFARRTAAGGVDFPAGVFLFFFVLFLFYSLNFRTLDIRITPDSFRLSFGIFAWTISLNDIDNIQTDDDLPVLTKYGGAGIHFMFFHKRYRASFNFLEHSRVVIALKRKAGLVRDVSFSTRHPNEMIRLIQEAMYADKTA